MSGGGRGLRAALVFLALVNMVPATEADGSWGVFSVVTAAGLAGLLLWRPGGAAPVPAPVVYVGVAASVAFLLREFFPPQGVTNIPVLNLAHFMMLLCGCKFLEQRTARDMGLAAIIAGLVLIIGAFVSGSILFAIAVAVDVTLGVWWVLAFQLRREAEAAAKRRAELGARERAALVAAASPRMALYRPSALLALGLSAASALIFVCMPRGWGHSMLGSIQRVMPSMSGYTEDAELSGAPLIESEAPVMRVRLTRDGRPIGGEDLRPYMRGTTTEQYYNGHWHKMGASNWMQTVQSGAKSDPEPLPASLNANPRYGAAGWRTEPELPAPTTIHMPRAELIEQEVWLDRMDGNALPAIYPAVAFGSESVSLVKVNLRDRSLVLRDAPSGVINYIVRSPETPPPRVIRALNPSRTNRPPPSPQSAIPPKVRQLAVSLARPAGDASDPRNHERIVHAFLRYLARPEFVYSLLPDTHRPASVDPIEHFLLVSHKGYCEYFATALALLCQSVDIPARRATGLYGGEYNPVGGFYQFRQRDAHAWTEVFFEGKGWTTVDASPVAGARRTGADLSLMSEVRRLASYLQFEWSTLVVAFDSDHRRELAGKIMNWLEGLPTDQRGMARYWSMIKAFAWGPTFFGPWQRAMYWLVLALIATVIILLLRLVWILGMLAREFMPRRRRGAAAAPRSAEAKFYDRALALLAHKGHVKGAAQTPREFAARLAASQIDLAPMPEITEWFYAAQYGGRALDAGARSRVRAFLQRLREEPSFGARVG